MYIVGNALYISEFQYLQLESLAARGNNDETLPIFENG